MSWERPFDQTVPPPSGAPARTLRDAANYIKTLPKSVRDSNEWRIAVHMLIEAAEDRVPMLFAKISILRGVGSDVERRKGKAETKKVDGHKPAHRAINHCSDRRKTFLTPP
jgi:hypothetical protein